MIVTLLAAAMTLTMVIATALGLHQEAQRVQVEERRRKLGRFGRSY